MVFLLRWIENNKFYEDMFDNIDVLRGFVDVLITPNMEMIQISKIYTDPEPELFPQDYK